jgi:hypothetical protein
MKERQLFTGASDELEFGTPPFLTEWSSLCNRYYRLRLRTSWAGRKADLHYKSSGALRLGASIGQLGVSSPKEQSTRGARRGEVMFEGTSYIRDYRKRIPRSPAT